MANSLDDAEDRAAGGRLRPDDNEVATLYALSREPAARSVSSSSHSGRKPITLSTKPLSTFKPIEDEIDDEDFAEAVTA